MFSKKKTECRVCGYTRNARFAAHILTAAKNAIAERQKPTTTPKKN